MSAEIVVVAAIGALSVVGGAVTAWFTARASSRMLARRYGELASTIEAFQAFRTLVLQAKTAAEREALQRIARRIAENQRELKKLPDEVRDQARQATIQAEAG